MSTENTPAPAATPAPSTSELPAGGAAPADGGVATSEQHTGQPADPNAQPGEGNGAPQNETPAHRKPEYRFGELTKQRNAAREEAAYWKGVAEAARQGQNAPAPPHPPAQAAVDEDPRPDPHSGKYPGKEFDPSYYADLAEWSGRQSARKLADEQRKEAEARQQREAEQSSLEAGRQRFIAAMEASQGLAESHPQYAEAATLTLERIARSEPVGTPGRLIDCVINAEHPQWVAAALATKPGLLENIQKLGPVERGLAIGRIDAQIGVNLRAQPQTPAAQPAAAPAPSSIPPTAPAPAPQVNGRSTASPMDPSKMSMSEYAAWRNAH